jgi:hypothetical protein
MPEFINGVKEAAVICNTIRHHVNVADAEIAKNRPRLDEIRDELILKIDEEINKKDQENKNLGYISQLLGNKHDLQKLRDVQIAAVKQVEVLTKECEAKLNRAQKLEVVGMPKEGLRSRHLKPKDPIKEMEEITDTQMKDMGEQISGTNPNYE